MTSKHDSSFCLALALLLLAVPASAATVTAKKPVKPAAVVIEPQPDATSLIAKAREAQNKGETELALRLAQSAIVAAPARTATYIALGDLYAATGQPEFARSYYDAALGIDPFDAAAQKAVAALEGKTDQRSANAEGTKTVTP